MWFSSWTIFDILWSYRRNWVLGRILLQLIVEKFQEKKYNLKKYYNVIYIQTIISNFWMTYSWIILPVYHKLWVWWKRLSVSHLWKIVNNFQLSFINFSYKNLQSTRCSFVLFCLFMEKKINSTNDVTSNYTFHVFVPP